MKFERHVERLEHELAKAREAINLALAELTGLDQAALDEHEEECLHAAVWTLVNATEGEQANG